MYQLVLLRHGQSQWNLDNRFTGWVDVDLSEQGVLEAKRAGTIIKEAGFEFDVVFTSVLKRAIKTAWNVLETMDTLWLPVLPHWRLNERHYGGLQGLNKAETAAKYGEEQVKIWRRSYEVLPPALEGEALDLYLKDPRYAKRIEDTSCLKGESLATTLARVIPMWEDSIAPAIRAKRRVLVVAHGNSLRALIKHLTHMSNEDILQFNIPTAQPLVYDLAEDLSVLGQRYLASEEEIKAAQAAVSAQGQARKA
jgi:2,3-bisphosphoglycerate-dependent phosphoglycerate mutase